MDEFLKTFEHAPALAAIVLVVWLFLKFFRWMLESLAGRISEFVDAVKQIQLDNIEARKRSQEVIQENTQVTAQVSLTMRECADSIREALHELRKRI